MDHIIVGIDGSTGSTRALDWAATEASRADTELEIVHALDIPMPRGIYANTKVRTSTVEELEKFSQDLLDTAARRAEEVAPDVKIETRMQIGSPTSVLVDASGDAAAVVVGSRGLGAFEGFIGSVSIKVAARASCPVYVIPDHGAAMRVDGPIVVGVDDSEFSVAALRFALDEALRRNVLVRAVTAYQLPMVSIPLEPGVITSFEQDSHDKAVAMIEKLFDQAQTNETRKVKTEFFAVEGPTVEAILAHAKDAQMIVVGSHGRGAARRLLLGSVSRLLLHRTDLPVAVVDLPH